MIRRSVLIAATAILGALATAMPANATGPVGSPSPVYPYMKFKPVTTVKDSRGKITAYELCAEGDATFLYVFGAWDFRIDGTRATTGGAAGPVVDEHDSRSGWPLYGNCLTVARLGYTVGHAHATFSYDGVGGDLPYTIEHTFTWCEGCPNPQIAIDVEDVQTEVSPL